MYSMSEFASDLLGTIGMLLVLGGLAAGLALV